MRNHPPLLFFWSVLFCLNAQAENSLLDRCRKLLADQWKAISVSVPSQKENALYTAHFGAADREIARWEDNGSVKWNVKVVPKITALTLSENEEQVIATSEETLHYTLPKRRLPVWVRQPTEVVQIDIQRTYRFSAADGQPIEVPAPISAHGKLGMVRDGETYRQRYLFQSADGVTAVTLSGETNWMAHRLGAPVWTFRANEVTGMWVANENVLVFHDSQRASLLNLKDGSLLYEGDRTGNGTFLSEKTETEPLLRGLLEIARAKADSP